MAIIWLPRFIVMISSWLKNVVFLEAIRIIKMLICVFYSLIAQISEIIDSGKIFALFSILAALIIPFATFMMATNDRKEDEKEFSAIEHTVILKHVMRIPLLVAAFLVGSVAGVFLLSSEDIGGDKLLFYIKVFLTFLIVLSVSIIVWIMIEMIIWLVISTRPDSEGSFCFKKWERYLENIDDTDFYAAWDKLFRNISSVRALQPAYITLFFKRVNKDKAIDKFKSYSIIYNNLDNIDLYNPDVLESVLKGIEIDYKSSFLLKNILKRAGIGGDVGVFFLILDEVLKGDTNSNLEVVVDDLVYGRLRELLRSSDENKIVDFANGIPETWKISSLVSSNTGTDIAKQMALRYPLFVLELRQYEQSAQPIISEHINNCIVGDALDKYIDKRLLADICEIYANKEILACMDDGSLEKKLVDSYIAMEPRFFASFNIYTVLARKKGRTVIDEEEKNMKEKNACILAQYIFPYFIKNSLHVKRMKRIISGKIRKESDNYRLRKIENIYKVIVKYT